MDKVVNTTNAKKGSKILDIATGTGQQIVYINFDRIEKVRKIVLQIIGEF
ncbi:MAG TPA: hypothetical protein PK669_00050 [Methanosarcina thermophila]|nr:hypothetical protein [Methanosarcina thermophila]HOA68932.1 hypothetical protein [Methanosarcina thermophila]HPT82146.1 hypothetical protein [Methanosarcina thermophila]HPZ18692.1 hypothetical protein [Methanosarcina thermophila]HQD93085.1 hypothetical protein [Methanosarcina thermophila]